MARAPKSYKRLPGVGRGLGSFVTLWQGKDHLLQVRSTSISERYKRFYFRDIQVFLFRKTKRALTIRIVFALLALLSALVALNTEFEVALVFWTLVGAFALIFVVDLIRGSSCECYVQTPVQIERLVTLRRTRKARRILDRIEPLIVEAQSAPSPE